MLILNILIAYDVNTETVEGQKRLRRVAKACTEYCQRVQKSLFECYINAEQFEKLEHLLINIIDNKKDSLRIYLLYGARERFVRVYGIDRYIDFEKPLIL
ncbi:CRISPR-associated endonuclease Cas2 [Brockia lithotrophica]|uniref:CRISPR-associated endonuclease Cas2 n=1 Tax=Brockia lithotrophica TaxID=933949 RepID=UPI001FE91B72|nr:CRISPR-associated endonuclease Cas2 [Brockia lithotrophica]